MSLPASSDPRTAAARPTTIGIVGTFDVENYGDLLFPLLAQAELGRRLPGAEVVAYSYNARHTPAWPYPVRAVGTLVHDAPTAGVLVGGGQLVRADTHFPIPVPVGTVVPYDIWLFPALAALSLGVPLVWNAIGAWDGGVAFTAEVREQLAAVAAGSDLVAVRDAITARVFVDAAPDAPVATVPDTAFGLARLLDPARPTPAYDAWRRELGLTGPYVAIQATAHLAQSRAALLDLRAALPDVPFVLLPICKVHGDRGGLDAFAGLGAIADDRWRDPVLYAEVIAHAMLAVGSSLHFGITALALRVPLLRVGGYDDRKYRILDGFAGAQVLRAGFGRADLEALRDGARQDPRVAGHAREVDGYWDRVASIFAARAGAGGDAPDRRALAAWTLRNARRQLASFVSAPVRLRLG